MRRDVSHQEETETADDALRALVRLLARAAAREALAATPQSDARFPAEHPESEDKNGK
jgi:hypothetical protein